MTGPSDDREQLEPSPLLLRGVSKPVHPPPGILLGPEGMGYCYTRLHRQALDHYILRGMEARHRRLQVMVPFLYGSGKCTVIYSDRNAH